MVKAKCRQLAAIAAENETRSADEDSWVLVKKQKITILIPPLPVLPPPQSPTMKRIQTKSRKTVKNRSQISAKRYCKHSLVKQNKSTVYAFRDENQSVGDGSKVMNTNIRAAPPGHTNKCLPLFSLKTASEGLNLPASELPLRRSLDLVHSAMDVPIIHSQPTQRTYKSSGTLAGASREHIGVAEALKSFAPLKRKGLPLHINGMRDVHTLSCLNIGTLQNQQIRALNVERKLKRAGGLTMWLISQGLGQFIDMFKSENIDKLQLLNLTMGKLKDMGVDAVGPRRKLIHAIDCLCQPYYF